MAKSNEFYRVENVKNPLPVKGDGSDEFITAGIRATHVEWCRDNAESKYLMLSSAYQVLQNPLCIVEVRRDRNGKPFVGYCYTGRPLVVFPKSFSRPTSDGEVFSVYLTTEFVIWEWGIEDCNPDDDLKPVDNRGDRFHEVFFPSTENQK